MRGGRGVWHAGGHTGTEVVKGFQMWVALPAHLENQPAQSHYLRASEVPHVGPARLILGGYDGARSPIDSPAGINYMDGSLKRGQKWTYLTPKGHGVGWVAVYRGSVR